VLRRAGPEWDPARPLEEQTGWGEHASSDATVRATLGRDPWSGSHLVVDTTDPWTIRLDGRRA